MDIRDLLKELNKVEKAVDESIREMDNVYKTVSMASNAFSKQREGIDEMIRNIKETLETDLSKDSEE